MLPDTIRTRGLHTFVRFYPSAVMDKQHKQAFLVKSNEGFDWQKQDFAEHHWQLQTPQSEGDPRSHLKFTVQPDVVSFEDVFPTGPLDLFADNVRLALEGFASVFAPRQVLVSGALIRLTAQATDTDARVFLGNRCMHMEERLTPLGRPVHAVGMKLLMPAFGGKDKPNWQAEVKIESLIEDVRQLFIEVDARWMESTPWSIDVVMDRLRTANEFATTKVVDFLRQFTPGA